MTSELLKVGLIGAGSMGHLHARTVVNHPRSSLTWVQDVNVEAARKLAERYESRVLREPDFHSVDAVIVASSTPSHFDLASHIIHHGLPLLIEKPLCEHLSQVETLIAQSSKSGTVLRCGFVERFNPAIRTAMSLLREPIAFHSFRHSPMNPRTKGGVENDLLIHDVDIALRVFSEKPSGITGMRFSLKGGADAINSEISEALLRFSRGRIAHCSSSLRSHRKIRTISIAEPDRLIELDLIRQDITIYRHIEESASIDDLGYQQQTIIEIPLIQFTGEPLMLQWDQFTRILLEDVDDGVSPESLLLPHQVIHRLSESDCQ